MTEEIVIVWRFLFGFWQGNTSKGHRRLQNKGPKLGREQGEGVQEINEEKTRNNIQVKAIHSLMNWNSTV